VILVNDIFQPTLEVSAGQQLEVTIINDMPADYPDVSEGLSFHWHGFNMQNGERYA
jgi:L-ascorbate oxidase